MASLLAGLGNFPAKDFPRRSLNSSPQRTSPVENELNLSNPRRRSPKIIETHGKVLDFQTKRQCTRVQKHENRKRTSIKHCRNHLVAILEKVMVELSQKRYRFPCKNLPRKNSFSCKRGAPAEKGGFAWEILNFSGFLQVFAGDMQVPRTLHRSRNPITHWAPPDSWDLWF